MLWWHFPDTNYQLPPLYAFHWNMVPSNLMFVGYINSFSLKINLDCNFQLSPRQTNRIQQTHITPLQSSSKTTASAMPISSSRRLWQQPTKGQRDKIYQQSSRIVRAISGKKGPQPSNTPIGKPRLSLPDWRSRREKGHTCTQGSKERQSPWHRTHGKLWPTCQDGRGSQEPRVLGDQ